MDSRFLGILLFFGGLILAGIAAVMVARSVTARTMERRVAAISRMRTPRTLEEEEKQQGATPQLSRFTRLLQSLGETIRQRRMLYSDKDIIALEGLISSAGLSPEKLLPVLLAMKVIMLVGIPLVALGYGLFARFSVGADVGLMAIAIPLGMLGPDFIINLARGPHLAALRRGVPDALDLLVVCSEAGMGLENALDHVSNEMRHSNPQTALALARLLDDLRVLPDRREALNNFASRTGVQGAQRVSTMLAQSMKYGTPLSQALRTVALDLRRERMVALEERAAKLPVKLTIPLMLCLMPALFIVLMGPAFLRLMAVFGK